MYAFTELTCQALNEFVHWPDLVNALKGSPDEVQQARKMASLASREIERGFTFTFGQATVVLWSSLEAAIRDLLVR